MNIKRRAHLFAVLIHKWLSCHNLIIFEQGRDGSIFRRGKGWRRHNRIICRIDHADGKGLAQGGIDAR